MASAAASSSSLLLLKRIPLRRLPQRFLSCPRRLTTDRPSPRDELPPTTASSAAGEAMPSISLRAKEALLDSRLEHPDYRRWKDREEEILKDVEPVILLTKEILHSEKYMDGERLKDEDENIVIEKLLAYHPHAEDKVGCGLDSIMVDCHPQFKNSRCLFVVRTDGAWIDFSYQKCLRAYIRNKYPSYAERFIKEHLKRTSG